MTPNQATTPLLACFQHQKVCSSCHAGLLGPNYPITGAHLTQYKPWLCQLRSLSADLLRNADSQLADCHFQYRFLLPADLYVLCSPVLCPHEDHTRGPPLSYIAGPEPPSKVTSSRRDTRTRRARTGPSPNNFQTTESDTTTSRPEVDGCTDRVAASRHRYLRVLAPITPARHLSSSTIRSIPLIYSIRLSTSVQQKIYFLPAPASQLSIIYFEHRADFAAVLFTVNLSNG